MAQHFGTGPKVPNDETQKTQEEVDMQIKLRNERILDARRKLAGIFLALLCFMRNVLISCVYCSDRVRPARENMKEQSDKTLQHRTLSNPFIEESDMDSDLDDDHSSDDAHTARGRTMDPAV
ncbi:hypothetical protein BST61_g1335 [Cercospora zeina]